MTDWATSVAERDAGWKATLKAVPKVPVAIPDGVPLADVIAAKLLAAEARRDQLRPQLDNLALDAVLGTAAENYGGLRSEYDAAVAEVDQLKIALGQAKRRDRKAAAKRIEADLREALKAFEDLAEVEVEAAEGLQSAIEAMAEKFSRFRQARSALLAATPAGVDLRSHELGFPNQTVGREFARHNVKAEGDTIALPGAIEVKDYHGWPIVPVPLAEAVVTALRYAVADAGTQVHELISAQHEAAEHDD
jgi:hypothetical protein